MAIEFDCQGCGQRLSTPDGSGGRQCQCPDCGMFVTIPTMTTIAGGGLSPNERSPASSPSASQSALQSATSPHAPGTLKIPCPRCLFDLICSPSLLGTKGQCRNCQHIFTIVDHSTPQPRNAEAESPELIFRCPACKQLFSGQAEMEGRKGKCHACGEVFAIALEPAPIASSNAASLQQLPASSSLTPATTDAAASAASRPPLTVDTLADTQSSAAQQPANVVDIEEPSDAPFQFNCRNCDGVMEVPASTSGQQTMCPYCGETLTIPLPTAARSSVLTTAASLTERTFAPAPAATSATPPSTTTQNLWTELGDASGATYANPYAAPSTQIFDELSAQSWSTSTRRKRPRGLTFSNAFELTFNSLFPTCLLAPLLFFMVVVVASGIFFIGRSIARQVIISLGLNDLVMMQVVLYGMLSCVMVVSVLMACAAYCMTCNTALHAVRGKPVTSKVVFNVGQAYGGMLAIMLGWTLLNVLRKIGLPYLVQEIARTNGLQTAALVGISLAIVFLLIQLVGTFLLSFVPFALLDGHSLFTAIETSISICLSRIAIVLPVLVCGWLLYVFVGIISIGLGLIVLIGALFYLNAAIYHLVES